jgi:hypothetical protein
MANGTTLVGRVLAFVARRMHRLGPMASGPDEIRIASGYALPMPAQDCFTIGDVIFCRGEVDSLLNQPQLLGHETHHSYQYATVGPFFFPLYFLACGWSHVLTGDYASRNTFERRAGLAAGGYRDVPLRPIWLRLGFGRAAVVVVPTAADMPDPAGAVGQDVSEPA